jgi:hypothetical protein
MKGTNIFPHRYEKNAHIARRSVTKLHEYLGFLPLPLHRLRG